MSSPLLTIVVAVRNDRDRLQVTLDLLLQHTKDRREYVEIIVVDGASTDGTDQVARLHGVVDITLSEPDRGIYDAMNKGARLASGRWLQFLNAGDAFTGEGALAAVLHELEEFDPTWLVVGAINMGRGSGLVPRAIPSLPHRWFAHAVGIQPHCHQASFFNRDVFLALNGHSELFGTAGDFDLILRFGVIAPPRELSSPCIAYEGGGVSDGQWKRNSQLLHQVRVVRLGLDGAAQPCDRMLSVLVMSYAWTRVSLGRIRARLFARGR